MPLCHFEYVTRLSLLAVEPLDNKITPSGSMSLREIVLSPII